MPRKDRSRPLHLDALETRDVPAGLTYPGVPLPPAAVGPAEAVARTVSDFERRASRITITAVAVGGKPGTEVRLQANLHNGTILQLRNQRIDFYVGRQHFRATTNNAGHAEVRFTIPPGAHGTISYTVSFPGGSAAGRIVVR